MSKHRGVKPEQDRLDLSEGDFVDVKRRLTVGESRDIINLATGRVSTGFDEMVVTPDFPFMAAATYILGWSLLDYDGQPIPWPSDEPLAAKVQVLRQLDGETMKEIDEALTKHRLAHVAKKTSGGASESAATSPSASSSDGPTTS